MIHLITLFPAAQFAEFKARFPGKEISPQTGAPFGMMREVLLSPIGLPCNPPPWGTLSAIDLNSRKILWQAPLGTTEAMNPLGLASRLGTPTLGGPLATSGGLVFIGAAMDDYLRAFDARTGAELWTGRLPATGNSTPTYEWQGRQYVVIAAGGHGETGSPANRAAPARRIASFALDQLDRQAGRKVRTARGYGCPRPGRGANPVDKLARERSPAYASSAVANCDSSRCRQAFWSIRWRGRPALGSI
jgi:hypothetical protein